MLPLDLLHCFLQWYIQILAIATYGDHIIHLKNFKSRIQSSSSNDSLQPHLYSPIWVSDFSQIQLSDSAHDLLISITSFTHVSLPSWNEFPKPSIPLIQSPHLPLLSICVTGSSTTHTIAVPKDFSNVLLLFLKCKVPSPWKTQSHYQNYQMIISAL